MITTSGHLSAAVVHVKPSARTSQPIMGGHRYVIGWFKHSLWVEWQRSTAGPTFQNAESVKADQWSPDDHQVHVVLRYEYSAKDGSAHFHMMVGAVFLDSAERTIKTISDPLPLGVIVQAHDVDYMYETTFLALRAAWSRALVREGSVLRRGVFRFEPIDYDRRQPATMSRLDTLSPSLLRLEQKYFYPFGLHHEYRIANLHVDGHPLHGHSTWTFSPLSPAVKKARTQVSEHTVITSGWISEENVELWLRNAPTYDHAVSQMWSDWSSLEVYPYYVVMRYHANNGRHNFDRMIYAVFRALMPAQTRLIYLPSIRSTLELEPLEKMLLTLFSALQMGWARSVARLDEVPDYNKQWFVFPEISPAKNQVDKRLHDALILFQKSHMASIMHQPGTAGAVDWFFSPVVRSHPPPPGHPGAHGIQ